MPDVMEAFGAATREWFVGAFRAPTAAQAGAWAAIARGQHALVVAPTGSGKTLASFLWAIDRLAARPADAPGGTRVLYVSPLKALAVDVERNLRSPLVGVTQTAKRHGVTPPPIRVGVRSGDTTQAERRALSNDPPEILITTPESLFLMLTSAARSTLATVQTVIVDEVHAVAATKRGSHLALSLERLDLLLDRPAQRIGLSATVRPVEEVARFLGGRAPVTVVAPRAQKTFDLTVVVPVEDMADPDAAGPATDDPPGPTEGSAAGAVFDPDDPLPEQRTGSIWPHVESAITDLVLQHRASIVFANSRRLAERLTARLNEEYAERLEEQAGAESSLAPRGATADVGKVGASGSTRGAPVSLLSDPGSAVRPFDGDPGRVAVSGPESREVGSPLLARAHHGSVSKEQRGLIEDDLKSGRLRCVVATSSLELGIDMGSVDLVVQVGSPPSVASGLQRVGRAGHQVGEISKGVVFPVHQADLIHSTVAVDRMLKGEIESVRVPANPLDVLAQQTVAASALDELDVETWFDLVRRSAPFAGLPRSAFDAVLDLLAGRYPSDEFAELRPRVVWDRDAGTITGRPGAQRLAVTSGGTIPDRGLFGVFLVGGTSTTGNRVGELDEEMVYESRVGDVFSLGATSWRIQEITHDRVLVLPAFGEPGRVPFWKGDGLGRPAELGRAIGAFQRRLAATPESESATLAAGLGLDTRAVTNLLRFVREQAEATGSVPSDRTLVLERFRDELGDWRIVLHSPFGMQIHAPWALAIGARLAERYGIEGGAMAADDGIVLRVPDTDAEPPGADLFLFEPDEIESIVTTEVTGSAIFASRFRECAARALLLPRYNPGRRSPLWQQRQRASQLLDVAKKFPTFPIIFETIREVLQDVYDLPALTQLTEQLESRQVRLVETTTQTASPFARSLLFGYVGAFMYEGDSPLAERKAQALSLDATLLSELLGRAELRELLDPEVLDATEQELQRLAPDRQLKGVEGAADLLRMLGPLTAAEAAGRLQGAGIAEDGEPVDVAAAADSRATAATTEQAAAWLVDLVAAHRAIAANIGGEQRYAAIEDSSRLRDALGVALPIGVPIAFVEPVDDPLGDLVARFARTHAPFAASAAAARYGLGVAVVTDALRRLAGERRVTDGEFRPGATGTEWCDVEVLRRIRRRSLAALRREVEPVDAAAYARFLPTWQHVGGSGLRGIDGVLTVIDQLAGVPIPASAWETLVLPARVRGYSPAMLDELTATGEVTWSGAGRLAGADGWVALHLADSVPLTLPDAEQAELSPLEQEVLAVLGGGGAFFFRQLVDAVGASDDAALQTALWNLVWAGLISNDTFAPVRALIGAGGTAHRQPRRAPRARAYRGRGVRPTMPSRSGPPTAAGRWTVLPLAETDATVRAAATAEILLDRYGVVTRGAVQSERVPGGFALVYKTLAALEEAGRARRGYFIEQLGAAQFSTAGTVDRLREFNRAANDEVGETVTVCLAATDPANPYGAALPWPNAPEGATGHRPGRKAGALVVLVDGRLTAYVERGGKTVLLFTTDRDVLQGAAQALADTVRGHGVPALAIEKVDGEFVLGTGFGTALQQAGFGSFPKGLRLRA